MKFTIFKIEFTREIITFIFLGARSSSKTLPWSLEKEYDLGQSTFFLEKSIRDKNMISLFR